MYHNVAQIIDNSGVSKAEIARRMGIEPQNLNRLIKNDDIKLSSLTQLANIIGISVSDFLIKEKGKVIYKPSEVTNQVKESINNDYSQRIPTVVTVDNSGNENILYVPIKARAGYLVGYGDTRYISKLSTYTLPGLRNGSFRMFEVDGLSMSPTLKHGDKVIGGFVESLVDIRDNRIHVIVTTSGIVVKRVLNRITERGKLYLKSDTLTQKNDYPTSALDPSDIIEIWYAHLILSADFSEPSDIYRRINNLEIELLELNKAVKKVTK